jgi:hypothetical protein
VINGRFFNSPEQAESITFEGIVGANSTIRYSIIDDTTNFLVVEWPRQFNTEISGVVRVDIPGVNGVRLLPGRAFRLRVTTDYRDVPGGM